MAHTGAIVDLEAFGDLQFHMVHATQLRLAGSLDDDLAQNALRHRLDALHASLRASKVRSFTVDVRGLNFVNSSAIRLFVDWIAGAVVAGYTLVFLIDRTITWHRLSFSVLKSLAPAQVQIVEGSAAPPQAGEP